jgi:uncharacterized membrane protein
VGFIFGLLGVAILVFFIHHVATSIQASNIIYSVAKETEKGIANLFPDEIGDEVEEDNRINHRMGFERPILSDRSGYIQTMNEEALDKLSSESRGKVWVNFSIGDFVVQGTPLVYVETKDEITKDSINCIRKAFSIQEYRTIEQDTLFGIRQLVDIALKALSPGINDTTTAILCIDYLTSVLSHIINKKIPSSIRKIDGGLEVIVKRPQFKNYLVEAFSQIRTTGKGNYAVQERLLWSYKTLYDLTQNSYRKAKISAEIQRLDELINETFPLESEKRKLNVEYAKINQELSC